VETWGKRQYDGHACAMGCRSSNGENKDEDCSKHMKTGGSTNGARSYSSFHALE
jgi:hypothetical protein